MNCQIDISVLPSSSSYLFMRAHYTVFILNLDSILIPVTYIHKFSMNNIWQLMALHNRMGSADSSHFEYQEFPVLSCEHASLVAASQIIANHRIVQLLNRTVTFVRCHKKTKYILSNCFSGQLQFECIIL